MAAITKPSAPGWRDVVPSYRHVKGRAYSPFTLQSQVFIWPGTQWKFELTLPLMNATNGKLWAKFLMDLEDGDNHFALAVANYVPAGISSPMNVRLDPSAPPPRWHIGRNKFWEFDTIHVEEVK